MRWFVAGLVCVSLMFGVSACGGTRVIAPNEMEALKNPAPVESAKEVKQEAWNGGWFSLNEEFELPYPKPWKLKGGELVIRLDRSEWVTFGESRQAWAHVTVFLKDENVSLRISEGETAEAFGHQFECTHAFEKWEEKSQEYFHNSRFKVTR